MDPFTQRMMERARARRENLDGKLPSSKVPETNFSKTRSPLQEQNREPAQTLTVSTEVSVKSTGGQIYMMEQTNEVKVSPLKVVKGCSKENVGKSPKRKSSSSSSSSSDTVRQTSSVNGRVSTESKVNNADGIRSDAKSRLKRLGALYADKNISSPIHRTEESFSAEAEEPVSHAKNSSSRLARLAALADTINQWEDDLSHPEINRNSKTDLKREAAPIKIGDANHKSSEVMKSEPPVIAANKRVAASPKKTESSTFTRPQQQSSSSKKVVWDKAILETLESQGFSRTVSKSRLVYDFNKNSPQGDGSSADSKKGQVVTIKEEGKSLSVSEKADLFSNANLSPVKNGRGDSCNIYRSPKMGVSQIAHRSPNKANVTPEKFTSTWVQDSPRKVDQPKMGLKSTASPSSPKVVGSVMHRAAMYESATSPEKKVKDPAELSVSERKALFEKNRGHALIPKAAFSMAVPTKYLDAEEGKKKATPEKKVVAGQWTKLGNFGVVLKPVEERKQPSPVKSESTENRVSANKLLFERGANTSKENPILLAAQSERQKEMEMLLNRWNKNKQISSENSAGAKQTQENAATRAQVPTDSQTPPPPPPMPQSSPVKLPKVSSMQLKHGREPAFFDEESNHPMEVLQENGIEEEEEEMNSSPMKNYNTGRHVDPKLQYPVLRDVKKIRVSPPKPGKLYPTMSDIEFYTETESEVPDENDQDDYDSSESIDSCTGDTSFGREILLAAGLHKSPKQAQDQSDSDQSESEAAALKDMDGFLDEALGDDGMSSDSESEGPTPPKRRDLSHSPKKSPQKHFQADMTPSYGKTKSPTTHSCSFKYSRDASEERRSPALPTHVMDGDNQMPLMHTVSFYRKQQNMALKSTPVRKIVYAPEPAPDSPEDNTQQSELDEKMLVREKVRSLLDEVGKQQTVISQASQALNLCCATVEFSGSSEQVEGERLLLLATHKRQAALHEIQRLEVEGTLRPGADTCSSNDIAEMGTLTVDTIMLPLKSDYVQNMPADDMCHHFVLLLRCQEQVLASPVIAATPANLKNGSGLQWKTPLRLTDLYSDFKATLEVYSLKIRKEILPHNVKYHINNANISKKDSKLRLTPKKILKQESRLIMPTVQSPAGPSAVRSPSFQLTGYVVFSLREVSRTHFTLNKVAHKSPLEGSLHVVMHSELSVDITQRGFLSMFEDVSGFGAWHRRWFVLKGTTLSYWKYPDEEKKKAPIGSIDLRSCSTETVGLVSRDICARLNTFLLETVRSPQPDDEDSLVLVCSKNRTIIRHLLAADSKEDRIAWCQQLNKTLSMMRAWGNKS